MKFHEMEEGKKYKANEICNSGVYQKKQGLLWRVDESRWSINNIEQVAKMDFTEILQYVTFEEAVEWMKDGKKAKFYNSEYYMNYQETLCISHCGGCSFRAEMLEPKWILL